MPMACWSSMTPGSPGTLTTRPPRVPRCRPQVPPDCPRGLGAARCHRRPAARGDRPAIRRPAAVPHRRVRPGGPGQAAPGRPPARDPDIACRGAVAAAAAASRLRAPALAHPARLSPGRTPPDSRPGPEFSSRPARSRMGRTSCWRAARADGAPDAITRRSALFPSGTGYLAAGVHEIRACHRCGTRSRPIRLALTALARTARDRPLRRWSPLAGLRGWPTGAGTSAAPRSRR